MSKLLSIVMVTARENPRFDCLTASLRQALERAKLDYRAVELIVIDKLLWGKGIQFGRRAELLKAMREAKLEITFVHKPPKAGPWQGPTRLTKRDYWAKCNASNTGLLLATGKLCAMIDDCIYLHEDWVLAQLRALQLGYSVAGTVKSIIKPVFEDGVLQSYDTVPGDSQDAMRDTGMGIYRTSGNFLWGMNSSFPREFAVKAGGYDAAYDGQRGFEASDFGIRIERAGCAVVFDPTCLVFQILDTHTAAPEDSSSSEIVSNRKLLQFLEQERARCSPSRLYGALLAKGIDWRTQKLLGDL